MFKSGENHIQILGGIAGQYIQLVARYSGDQMIVKLAMAKDALNRAGVAGCSLVLPYFPGARQDRVCNEGESLSSAVYAKLINALEFDHVTIFDPHSDVTPALINNVRVVDNHRLVKQCVDSLSEFFLISPDAGANKKVFGLSKFLGGIEVVRSDKIRDVTNGQIIDTQVFADDLGGKICVIVDDIISGGRTFLELAKKLKQKNAGDIWLIVSHHEGVATPDKLIESGISRVFTTDSLANNCLVNDKLTTVFNVEDFTK